MFPVIWKSSVINALKDAIPCGQPIQVYPVAFPFHWCTLAHMFLASDHELLTKHAQQRR